MPGPPELSAIEKNHLQELDDFATSYMLYTDGENPGKCRNLSP